MENYIECPHCKRTIKKNSVIEEAAESAGSTTQSIFCECGERISYWQVTAQLRDQKTIVSRFKKWVRS